MNKVANHVRGVRQEITSLALLLALALWVSVGVATALTMLADGHILAYVWAFVAAFSPTLLVHFR